MRFGVTLFATDRSIGIVELARAVEERGLDSLWVPEHTHIPVSRRTPYPAGVTCPTSTADASTRSSVSRPRRSPHPHCALAPGFSSSRNAIRS